MTLLLAAAGCSGGANDPAPSSQELDIGEAQGALNAELHPLGARLESQALLDSKRIDSRQQALTIAAALPTSVDLSPRLPRVGDQGGESSCVGWAVAYATKTLHEVNEMKWPPSADDHTFSASWVYNQINGGVDSGSSISDALTLLVNKGADTISSFPYVDGQFMTQPSAASMTRAAHYKAQSWNTIVTSVANFKGVLAQGNAVVVSLNVLPDMDNMNGTTNTVYDTDAGTRASFTRTCNTPTSLTVAQCQGTCNAPGKCGTCNTSTNVCTVPACTAAPCSRGGHAVAIVGYDDASQTFRFINSWGSGFNGSGYGSFSYAFVTNSNLALNAFVLVDKANVPGLQDSTMTWQETANLLIP